MKAVQWPNLPLSKSWWPPLIGCVILGSYLTSLSYSFSTFAKSG